MADGNDWCSVTTGLIVGAVLLLTIWFWRAWRETKTFLKLGIPGPSPLPFVGNAIPTLRRGALTKLEEWKKQHGNIFGVFLPVATVVVGDPEALRELMVKKFAAIPNRGRFPMFDYAPWSNSLLFLRDDHWKHVRSQLSPTFSSGKLKRVFPVIESVTNNLTKNLKQFVNNDQAVELKTLSGNFAMDVIAGAAFGLEVDSIQRPQDSFVQHGEDTIKRMTRLFPIFLAFPSLTKLMLKLKVTIPSSRSNEFYLSILASALKERRLEKTKYPDFLQLLVEAEKEGEVNGTVDAELDHTDQLTTSAQWNRKGLSQNDIYGNALTFLFAGYDTTSSAMAFTLFCLAANKHCLRKALEEVDEKVGKSPVDYEKANELTYLDMCMNEAVRLFPPVAIADRQAVADTEVGGYHVPEGMTFIVPIFMMHRDPQMWPDPLKFDPERHTPEARAKRHPFAFMPFGLGPRNCIGMRFAQLEIRMAIATLLQHYTPVLCDKSVYPPRFSTFNRYDADDGLWVKFEPRRN